jgi:hypothetical protein
MLRRYLSVPVAFLIIGCSTGPDEQSVPGTYSVSYEPPLLASAAENCDRLIPNAILSLNELGDFDLSIDVVDDCSRGGGGPTPSQIQIAGHYTRQVARLSFTPSNGTAPLFTGTLEGDFVRLNLPPAVGIAIIDVELRVGPRER